MGEMLSGLRMTDEGDIEDDVSEVSFEDAGFSRPNDDPPVDGDEDNDGEGYLGGLVDYDPPADDDDDYADDDEIDEDADDDDFVVDWF